jgi:hypothetical protein
MHLSTLHTPSLHRGYRSRLNSAPFPAAFLSGSLPTQACTCGGVTEISHAPSSWTVLHSSCSTTHTGYSCCRAQKALAPACGTRLRCLSLAGSYPYAFTTPSMVHSSSNLYGPLFSLWWCCTCCCPLFLSGYEPLTPLPGVQGKAATQRLPVSTQQRYC